MQATALHVPSVVVRESLYLLQPDEDDGTRLVKVPIDLSSYFAHGILGECEVEGDEEMRLFVQYATRLDDGEAACLAVAKHRGWSLATDDRPASNFAQQEGVPVLTTAGLVKLWAKSVGAEKREIVAVLSDIQRFAKFVPRQTSPDAKWWFSHFPSK